MPTELIAPELAPADTDNPDKAAHRILDTDWELGYVFGQEVTALCGYRWIPRRDPAGFPICGKCQRIYESLPES